jgi:alkylated DNA repair protein (DNA oxidative demethylase)
LVTDTIEPGAVLLRGFAEEEVATLVAEIEQIAAAAPFRHMLTPGGFRMSVAMTNCGAHGWITDKKGYRYVAADPESGRPWPMMPGPFRDLAARAAAASGFADFAPDSCLINRYVPGARMALHQDKDEADFGVPIVSVSLGLSATFLWGGAERRERPRRIPLLSGDVVVWGGPARLRFHGIDTLADGIDPVTGNCRYNLTFRKAA